MKPLLSKEEIADLLAPLEPEAEKQTGAADKVCPSDKSIAEKLPIPPLQIRIVADGSKVLLKELLQIQKGSTLLLDSFTGKPLDLYLDNQRIARCKLEQDNGTFCIKVTEVTLPQELLNQQG